MWNRIRTALVLLAAFALFLSNSQAQEKGTRQEATALVDDAVAHIKDVGAEAAFKDFMRPGSRWIFKDLYVFVFEARGNELVNVSHGANAKLVGKSLGDMQSPDGKTLIRDMWMLANSKGSGWYDYEWPNPQNKAIEKKTSYVKKIPNFNGFVGAGVYR